MSGAARVPFGWVGRAAWRGYVVLGVALGVLAGLVVLAFLVFGIGR